MLCGMETPPEDTSLYHMGCEISVTAELLSSNNLFGSFNSHSDPSTVKTPVFLHM